MKKSLRGIIAFAISASMLFSLAGCADKANQQVIEAADSFASSVTNLDSKKISKSVSEDVEDDEHSLATIESVCNYKNRVSDDAVAIIDAVKATMTYEIDEESVEASSKDQEGEIDVVFACVNLESILKDEDNVTDLDTLIDAIEAADVEEKTITLSFVLEDDEWKVSDLDSIVSFYLDFYFAASDFEFPVDYASCVKSAEWINADSGDSTYDTAYAIELYMDFDYDSVDSFDCTFECVNSAGEYVYDGYGTDGYVYAGFTSFCDEYGYFYPDTYTITFFADDGTEVYSDSCTVENAYVPVEDEPIVEENYGEEVYIGDNILFSSGSDAYMVSFYDSAEYENVITEVTFEDTGLYFCLETYSYYDADALFYCDVYLDDVFMGTVEYINPTDSNDSAWFLIEWSDGSTIGTGVFVIDAYGFNGEHYGTITVDIE